MAMDPDANGAAPEDALVAEAVFIVYLDGDGHWLIELDPERPMTVSRPATFNDVFHAAVTIQRDMTASQAANQVVGMMRMQAQQMVAQAQSQKLLQKLQIPGMPNPRG